ncbi:MAG: type II toxin-antitoxin system RelE/ParE family toxin [Xanthomonadales bacterium]|nr:type II toxin-antitoxin system RelE/ParE family toxin [Xanthomonadales bacterium]
MGSYRIRIKQSARKELEAVSTKADRRRIIERIQALATNPRPHGCSKLSGRELYRVRQGQYRILYSIKDQELLIHVIRIAHRKSAYR